MNDGVSCVRVPSPTGWWFNLAFFATFALLSCAPICEWHAGGLASNVRELQEESEKQEARLATIQQKIAEAERKQKLAEKRAEIQECKANLATLKTDIKIRAANCMEELATFNACEARASSSRGVGAAVGCLLGAAIATGSTMGVGAVTFAGCAAGLAGGHVTAKGCKVPNCKSTLKNLDRIVLRENGLKQFPVCGDSLGIIFSKRQHDKHRKSKRLGTRETVVAKVLRNSRAWDAGIRRGDVITTVGKKSIKTTHDFFMAIGEVATGDSVVLRYCRKGKYHSVKVVAEH